MIRGHNKDYWEPPSDNKTTSEPVVSVGALLSSKTGITLTNKTLTINPDCYVQILLEYVRNVIKFDQSVNFDFCDENGKLLKIYTLKECEYATKVFQHTWNYIIVLFQKNDNGRITKLEPYVHKTSKMVIDICTRLTRNLGKGKSSKLQRKRSLDSGIFEDGPYIIPLSIDVDEVSSKSVRSSKSIRSKKRTSSMK